MVRRRHLDTRHFPLRLCDWRHRKFQIGLLSCRESTPTVLTSGTETGRWQNEYFLCDSVHFSYAFGVADNRYFGLAYSQRNGSGFAHVAVASDCASFAGRMADATRWQAHQTHAVPQFGLPVQFQQRNVVVQRLAVVVVVNVCGGHAQRLRTRASELARQIVVADAHIDRIARPNNAESESG